MSLDTIPLLCEENRLTRETRASDPAPITPKLLMASPELKYRVAKTAPIATKTQMEAMAIQSLPINPSCPKG